MAFGRLVDTSDHWGRAEYSTANLNEWRPETGLRYSMPLAGGTHQRLDWEAPSSESVKLDDATLTFAGRMRNTGQAYAPDWSITTWQAMVVDSDEQLTINEYHRRYAQPLRGLLVFAADRPDTMTRELLYDAENKWHFEIWRQGPVVEPPPWRPGDTTDLLFLASELPSFQSAIERWWTLHEDVWPALGFFAQHVQEGNMYSPARLVTLHTALEAYCRPRFGDKKFQRLRDFAEVPTDVTGCTNNALNLLGFCRSYFAHLTSSQKYTERDAENGTLPSIRRGSALLQACLLRELGLSAAETEAILRRHHARWPLP